MKILCWNIAGIRASLKRNDFDFLLDSDYNIICIHLLEYYSQNYNNH